jgi:hypothetical protein
VPTPKKTRVFISFDYDHDQDLKNLLVGQSRHKDSPFFIEDWSIKQETKSWKADARKRIRLSDVVIVICGHHTHQAVGVTAEINIAREEAVPFRLLRGRKSGWVRRPQGASWLWDTLHPWAWNKLRSITKVKG